MGPWALEPLDPWALGHLSAFDCLKLAHALVGRALIRAASAQGIANEGALAEQDLQRLYDELDQGEQESAIFSPKCPLCLIATARVSSVT